MWNVLLDPLPTEWNGYQIDSDFQTGIMISQCLSDEELSDREKFYTAVNLLFPEEKPDMEDAADAIKWFLNECHHDNNIDDKKPDVIVLDFDIDQWRIYAAFLRQYKIDLNREPLHWFTFIGLLNNLDECALTNVMSIRQKEITNDMAKEERDSVIKAKKIFCIKPIEKPLSEEEKNRIEKFMHFAKGNK